MGGKRTVPLTIKRKFLILLARNCIDGAADPGSPKWMKLLYGQVNKHDESVQLRNIRDWCLKHEWITDDSLDPIGMGRYWNRRTQLPTKFGRNYHGFPKGLCREMEWKLEARKREEEKEQDQSSDDGSQSPSTSESSTMSEDRNSPSVSSRESSSASVPASPVQGQRPSASACDASVPMETDESPPQTQVPPAPATPSPSATSQQTSVSSANATAGSSADSHRTLGSPATKETAEQYGRIYKELAMLVQACNEITCPTEYVWHMYRVVSRNYSEVVIPKDYELTRSEQQHRIKREMMLMQMQNLNVYGVEEVEMPPPPKTPRFSISRRRGENILVTIMDSDDEEEAHIRKGRKDASQGPSNANGQQVVPPVDNRGMNGGN